MMILLQLKYNFTKLIMFLAATAAQEVTMSLCPYVKAGQLGQRLNEVKLEVGRNVKTNIG